MQAYRIPDNTYRKFPWADPVRNSSRIAEYCSTWLLLPYYSQLRKRKRTSDFEVCLCDRREVFKYTHRSNCAQPPAAQVTSLGRSLPWPTAVPITDEWLFSGSGVHSRSANAIGAMFMTRHGLTRLDRLRVLLCGHADWLAHWCWYNSVKRQRLIHISDGAVVHHRKVKFKF